MQVKEILAQEFPIKENVALVKCKKFETDEIKTPVEVTIVDSLLFLKNFSGDYFISVFNVRNGQFICDIAPRGLGPDEFLFVSSLYKKNRGISFFDPNLHRIFHAESLDGKYDDVTYSSIYVPVDTVDLCSPMWICPLKENVYCAAGIVEGNRCVLLDSTAHTLVRFGKYPRQEELEQYSDIALGFAFQGFLACNEKGNRMAIADNIGASVQFYDMENLNNPVLLCERSFIIPQFKDETTTDSWGVSFLKDKNIIGALGAQSYKDYALILFSGANTQEDDARSRKELLVYTWNGTPKKHIELDKKCFLFAVDEENGTAYFFCRNEGYDYSVYKMDLSVILK